MSYNYRRTIVINASKAGGATHTNFPFPVVITDATFKSAANGGNVQNANGYDIAFFSDSSLTTALKFEIEYYSASAGSYIAWVKLPTFSHTADTTIYIGYGDALISTTQADPTNVWDANFKSVHHLPNGTSLTSLDSTGSFNGTPNNTPTAQTGQVDGGAGFVGASQQNITTASSPTGAVNTALTYEGWAYCAATTDKGAFVMVGNNTDGFGIGLGGTTFDTVGNILMVLFENTRWVASVQAFGTGWHYFALVLETTTGYPRIYWDGNQVYSDSTGAAVGPTGAMKIGGYLNGANNRFWTGRLDEIRTSNTRRTDAWILASFNSQSNPATFYTLGSELDIGQAEAALSAGYVELALGGYYYDKVIASTPLGFWLLNEMLSTSTVRDSSGNSRTGTSVGGITYGQRGMLPHGGTAMTFNGTTGYANMGDVAVFEFASAFSISALVRSSGAVLSSIVSKKNTTNGGWALYMAADGKVRFFAETSAPATVFDVTTDAGEIINDGEDHHVVATWNGTTAANGVSIYIDGVLVKQGTAVAGTIAANAASLLIGAQYDGGVPTKFFDGSIQGVALFASELSSATVLALYNSTQWTDVTADVIKFDFTYGANGNRPMNRVANAGTMNLTMRNSWRATGGAGSYSPQHSNCRAGFTEDIPVRVRMTWGVETLTRFWGRIVVIDPLPGIIRSRRTECVAHDYMYLLNETDVREIFSQIDQTEATLLKVVLEALPHNVQPMSINIDTGVDTYPYAFYDLEDGVKATTAIEKAVVSAWGRMWVNGDGEFRYRNRQASSTETVEFAFDNDMTDLVCPTDRANSFNDIRATYHPKRVDAAATTVLFLHPGGAASPFLAHGESLTMWQPYRNPVDNYSTPVGGRDMVVPVSGTDFIANTASDGSGLPTTANVTVVATFYASLVKLVLTNNAALLGAYFTTLQVRGKGIYDLTAGVVVSLGDNPSRPLNVDLPYQSNPDTAQGIADIILSEWEDIAGQVESLRFNPHSSLSLFECAFDCAPGEIVSVTEGQVGLDQVQAIVREIHITAMGPSFRMKAELGLTPVVVGEGWLLGTAGRGELGTTTVLGAS